MFYTVYLFLPIYRKWTNDLNRRYDPAVAGNNKILYKREHLGLVQCLVIFFSDQLTHLIQVSFNSLQWVILGQTPTGVELNEGALRLLHIGPKISADDILTKSKSQINLRYPGLSKGQMTQT